jgi:hypothetical protein
MRLRSSLLLLAALGFTLVSAAPAELVRRDAEAESVAEGVPLRRLLARQALSSATCNLAAAQMSVGKSSNSFRNFATTS